MTLDALLAVMSQENVDRLAAALLPKDR